MSPVTHEMVDERSLALHRAVAAKLLEDPEVLERARRRVREWLETAAVDRRWAAAWWEVLERSPAEVARVLCDTGERARDLRQSSPFAGCLAPRERWAILRSLRSERGSM